MTPPTFRIRRAVAAALVLVAGLVAGVAATVDDARAAPYPSSAWHAQYRQHEGPRGGGWRRPAMRERVERQRPVQEAQPARPPEPQPEGRPGRLTPDERRALRQQINDAGREIYRPRRP